MRYENKATGEDDVFTGRRHLYGRGQDCGR